MADARIEFFRHNLGAAELEAIGRVLSGVILTSGPETAVFEKMFAQYMGASHAVAVSSCTSALFLSLLAHEIGPGDEVIVPAMTYVATLNAVSATGARPVLVDVESDTGLIDCDCVQRAIGPRTRAVIPVHLYGQMTDMERLKTISETNGLALIEDSAHCMEGERNGYRPGQLGDCACFSFYTTKSITAGEGGMVVTNSSSVAERIQRMRNQGTTRSAHQQHESGYRHWDQLDFGMKLMMSDIQSAMLIPQRDKIEATWQKRCEIAKRYDNWLERTCDIVRPTTHNHVKHGRHLYTVLVPPEKRDTLLGYMDSHNIGVAVNYRAVHLLEYQAKTLGHRLGDMVNAENIGACTLSLPLYAKLREDEQRRVVDTLLKGLSLC